VRLCERNNSADTKVSEEGGGGGAPGTRAEIPLQPVEQIMTTQAVPCSPWRSTVEQISIYSPGRTPCQSREMPEGGCDPVGSLCWSRLLAGPVSHGKRGPHIGAGLLSGLVTLWWIHAGAVCA